MPRSTNQWIILTCLAILGWAYCGTIMGLGQQFIPMKALLIIHMIAAPAGFGLLTIFYFRKYPAASPLFTACFWTGFIILADAILVAGLIIKSFDMFRSPIGTWIPFTLIFCTSFFIGKTAGSQS